MPDEVVAWAEQTYIPTYRIGKPDKNPMFLEKRVLAVVQQRYFFNNHGMNIGVRLR